MKSFKNKIRLILMVIGVGVVVGIFNIGLRKVFHLNEPSLHGSTGVLIFFTSVCLNRYRIKKESEQREEKSP